MGLRRAGLASVLLALSVGLAAAASASAADAPGAVYALSNAPAGNAVVVYDRAGDGALTPAGSYPTGGAGSGAGLGSQGTVIVSDDRQWLFAVNPGSNSVSSLRIRPQGLELVGTASSGASLPTSLAYRRGLLYVRNAGVPNYGEPVGFWIEPDGSVALLDADGVSATRCADPTALSHDSRYLYTPVAARNEIAVFAIGSDGALRALPPLTETPAGLAGLAAF